MPETVKDRLNAFLKVQSLSQKKFAESVGLSAGYVNNIRVSIQPKTLSRIADVYPELNTAWLLTGEGEMLRSAIASSGDLKPRVPVSVMAGFTGGAEDQVMLRDCEMVPAIPVFRTYDFTIAVRGDSMAPNYLSGDEVAVKLVRDRNLIEWGEVYVVVTTEGAVLKRLFKSDDPTKIICVSYNPDYAPFEIDAEAGIRAFYKVVGLIRQI